MNRAYSRGTGALPLFTGKSLILLKQVVNYAKY